MKILLVADHPSVAEQVRGAVAGLDDSTSVFQVSTPQRAIALLDEGETYDIVVGDNDTHPTGGLALAREIKARGQMGRDVPPVVLLIARTQDKWLANWAQADAYILKPADPFDLVETLQAIVAGDPVPALPGIGGEPKPSLLDPTPFSELDSGDVTPEPAMEIPGGFMTAVRMPDVLATLLAGDDLDDDTTAAVMSQIMSGDVSPVRVAGLLMALRMKGETAEEIAGLVRAMRTFALPVAVDGPSVDTCGTGGDRAGTFNVSTLSALVAAGAGAKVAKHGNRAASGKCGSADLLEAWGIVIDLPPEGVEACIAQVGIGFCFAPRFHPAMRHVMPARRELGVPTVFNFLGPLTNPAGARFQTIGVSDRAMAPKMAGVLARLDTEHALVFHGSDGLDELTTTGPSTIWEVRGEDVSQYEFDPADHEIERATIPQLKGGGVEDNLRIADAILDGEPGAPADIVALGAGAALMAADLHDDWSAAIAAARASLSSGAARDVRDRWVTLSKSLT